MGAVPLWWVHFGVECSPIYLLAAARAFERSFFATMTRKRSKSVVVERSACAWSGPGLGLSWDYD